MKFAYNKKNDSLHSHLYIRADDPEGDTNLAKKIILQEYSKYPKIIEKSKLDLVNLVSNLRVKNNADIDTFVKNSESPEPEACWMYIDIDYLEEEEYFRQCVNHEIWHLYDYSTTGSFTPEDPEWILNNPKDFTYGHGGWIAYHSEFENEFHPMEGFITSYATLDIDEDKAETFMYMFADHMKPLLEKATKSDKQLRRKVDLLMNHTK